MSLNLHLQEKYFMSANHKPIIQRHRQRDMETYESDTV